MVWESLGAFWQTSSGLSCNFYWGVASVWPLNHKSLIGGVLQRWLSFWKVVPSPQRNSGALSVTIGFLVPDQYTFLSIAQFGWVASSRKSLGGSKLLPFIKNGGWHCVIGDLQWSLRNWRWTTGRLRWSTPTGLENPPPWQAQADSGQVPEVKDKVAVLDDVIWSHNWPLKRSYDHTNMLRRSS